jgi:hypothetical protein
MRELTVNEKPTPLFNQAAVLMLRLNNLLGCEIKQHL